MSVAEIERLLRQVCAGGSFAAQVASDPKVVEGYALTAGERRAIVARDRERLLAMGVEPGLLDALDAFGTTAPGGV